MSLGGQAQDNFYHLLSEIVNYCVNNNYFERLRILKFVDFLLDCLHLCQYNLDKRPLFPSRFIGCFTLWQKRLVQVNNWIKILIEPDVNQANLNLSHLEKPDQHAPNINTIPIGIRYKIKKSLSSGEDVINLEKSTAAFTSDVLLYPNLEEKIWESLCKYNFQKHLSHKKPKNLTWRKLYSILNIKYMKDNKDPVSNLLLCQECNCLFWKNYGHPHLKNRDMHVVEVSPRDLMIFGSS